MKIIAIGDPHFHTDNVKEVELFIEKMTDLVHTEKPDYIVILGDLLHTHERLHTQALNKACEFVDKMRSCAPTFVLVGNHDMVCNSQFLTDAHWMNVLKTWENVTVVDRVHKFEVSDCSGKNYLFVLVPYVPNGRFMEALSTEGLTEDTLAGRKRENITCIFAHQEFYGCKLGAFPSEHGDKWDEKFPDVVSGHIHLNQTLGNVYYCGSSMQHSFGDTTASIIPVMDWKSPWEKYKLREISLGLPVKKTIYGDEKSLDEIDMDSLENSLNKLRISVKTDKETFNSLKKTSKYKQLLKKGVKVVLSSSVKKIQFSGKNQEKLKSLSFSEILHNLVMDKQDGVMLGIYNEII